MGVKYKIWFLSLTNYHTLKLISLFPLSPNSDLFTLESWPNESSKSSSHNTFYGSCFSQHLGCQSSTWWSSSSADGLYGYTLSNHQCAHQSSAHNIHGDAIHSCGACNWLFSHLACCCADIFCRSELGTRSDYCNWSQSPCCWPVSQSCWHCYCLGHCIPIDFSLALSPFPPSDFPLKTCSAYLGSDSLLMWLHKRLKS